MNMKRDWLEFARRLAEGARAKLAEDRQRLEAKAPRVKSREPHSSAPAAARCHLLSSRSSPGQTERERAR